MLNAQLGRAADAVYSLVGLLGCEALEGEVDLLALLLEKIVVAANWCPCQRVLPPQLTILLPYLRNSLLRRGSRRELAG